MKINSLEGFNVEDFGWTSWSLHPRNLLLFSNFPASPTKKTNKLWRHTHKKHTKWRQHFQRDNNQSMDSEEV